MIINYIGKVICWKTVVLHNYLVIDYIVIKNDFAMHHVFPLSFTLGHTHSDNEGFFISLLFFYLVRVVCSCAKTIILCFRILLSSNLDSHFLQTLCSAKARICVT